jgi:tetratricopeptide (TPR) repeat protein
VLLRARAAADAQPASEQRTRAARSQLARIAYLSGDYDAAAAQFARLTAEQPTDVLSLAYQGLIAARRGERVAALRVAERLRTLRPPYDRGQTTYQRARIAAVLGDRAPARRLLEQALSEGASYGVALHADSQLASLRGDPGFEALLRPRG